MPTGPHHKFKRPRRAATSFCNCLPSMEARALMALVRNGKESVESIRVLINVPARERQLLGRDRDIRSVRYRLEVLSEFERLVRTQKINSNPTGTVKKAKSRFSPKLDSILHSDSILSSLVEG
jgi:hypothetical protein